MKKEIQRLCNLGVLKWHADSEWALPTFIVPKKDTVRILWNFWELNKWVVRKMFPICKISTVLLELEGFKYATALYLNVGYYTIRLDLDASKIWISKESRWPPSQVAKGSHQTAEFRLESQCTQILFLCSGNRTPRIYSIPRQNQTTTKEGTSNSHTSTAIECQAAL